MASQLVSSVRSLFTGPKLKKAVTGIIIIWGIKLLVSAVKQNEKRKYYSKLAKKIRQERDLQISKELIDPSEIKEETRDLILNSTVTDLINLLNDDKITSEEILKVYH